MKETKKFFENNRLNKGYSRINNFNQSDSSFIRKQTIQLPPIDLIEEYEEIYPGTLERLMEIAKKEQEHRHTADLLAISEYNKAIRFGKIMSMVLITILAITTFVLAIAADPIVAATFSLSAFAAIAFVSFIYTKDSSHKNLVKFPAERTNHHHNNNRRRYNNKN